MPGAVKVPLNFSNFPLPSIWVIFSKYINRDISLYNAAPGRNFSQINKLYQIARAEKDANSSASRETRTTL